MLAMNPVPVAILRRRAFSLIELIVVIAILTILAAILFPVFARARANARKAACNSNLKQIGLAAMMYVQDYDERYPIANNTYPDANGRWFVLLQTYAKSIEVFACPDSGPIFLETNAMPSSYGWNIAGTWYDQLGANLRGNGFGYIPTNPYTPDGVIGLKQSAVEEPSSTIMVTDPTSNGYGGNGVYALGYQPSAVWVPVLHGGQGFSKTSAIVTNTSGGGNYLFADGHVKFLQAERSYCSNMWNVDKSVTSHMCSPFQP